MKLEAEIKTRTNQLEQISKSIEAELKVLKQITVQMIALTVFSATLLIGSLYVTSLWWLWLVTFILVVVWQVRGDRQLGKLRKLTAEGDKIIGFCEALEIVLREFDSDTKSSK